jgi:hypothetical protein
MFLSIVGYCKKVKQTAFPLDSFPHFFIFVCQTATAKRWEKEMKSSPESINKISSRLSDLAIALPAFTSFGPVNQLGANRNRVKTALDLPNLVKPYQLV